MRCGVGMLPGAGGMGEGYIGGEEIISSILFLQFSETKYMGYGMGWVLLVLVTLILRCSIVTNSIV